MEVAGALCRKNNELAPQLTAQVDRARCATCSLSYSAIGNIDEQNPRSTVKHDSTRSIMLVHLDREIRSPLTTISKPIETAGA